MTRAKRMTGALLGLAVGDAVGTTVEFKPRGTFTPVTDMVGGGPFRLPAGAWTDDTSLALCLATSLHECGGFDADDQMQRYVRWWQEGYLSSIGRCFDIGSTTSGALSRYVRTGDPFSGSADDRGAGNGSIMRLAPVPIRFSHCFPDDIERLAEIAAESSIPTHASPQCLSACRYMTIILAGLMHGHDRNDVLAPDWEPMQRLKAFAPLHPEVDAVASGSFRKLEPPVIKGSGYVVKSLEAALWAFHNAQSFEEAVLKSVNLGDDADTTGAVCGQFSGAYWGESRIPSKWLSGLAKREMIERALTGLLNAQRSEESA